MSTTTHIQRCREWIGEQIEAMGTLRTANTRDLSFKNWRQNTVTVLQRIWPEDRERVERFRRIVFTPPHSRADAKLSREWFGKGIGESRTYLNSLLEVIDREGVPEPAASDRERDADGLEDEVNFPMLDLSGAPTGTPSADSPAAPVHDAGGLDVTAGYTTPDDQGASPRDPRAPAPPTLSLKWKSATPSELRRRETLAPEAPPALGESDAAAERVAGQERRPAIEIPRAPSLPPAQPAPPARREPPARVVAKGKQGRGKAKKSTSKPKLKDLLGLDEFEARAQDLGAEAAPPDAAPAPKREPQPAAEAPPAPKREPEPVAEAPPAPKREPQPVAEAPPAPMREPEPVAEAPPAPRREPPPVAEAPPAPKREPLHVAEAPPAPRREPPPVAEAPPAPKHEPLPVAEAPPAPAASEPRQPAVRPATPAPPAAEDEFEAVNEEDRERATLDFMQNSPVFGVIGRPVQRRTDTTEFLDPDAVAVATLVAELGRYGVPEGMKASMAARLADVAKSLEAGDLDWALLRAAITDAMQYPELARRLLPVLLPWLERAA